MILLIVLATAVLAIAAWTLVILAARRSRELLSAEMRRRGLTRQDLTEGDL